MEAMMTLKTLSHTAPQLDQVARQFAHWRQNRSHPSERIPQALWDHAAALAAGLPYSQVAKHLRLSPSDLKKHLLAQQQSTSQMPAPTLRFVEVPPAPEYPVTRTATEIELQRADGARLRLRSDESTLPLAALGRAFLEAP
jgi:hypothetical protein